MYRMEDMATWREYHREPLREAEDARLARQPRKAPLLKRETYPGRVRHGAALLLSVVGLAVVMVASVAYALEVQCPPSIGDDVCLGTDGDDVMKGTDGLDSIVGLGGSDVIHGLGEPDRLTGDGNAAASQGDDRLFGGDGADILVGGAGYDLLSGQRGDDQISADFLFNDGTDTVRGGHVRDTVNAVEGQVDFIDCGPGRDSVQFDAGLDSVRRCEIEEAL